VLFIHDEIILETPKEKASAAGDELARLMVEAMRLCIPHLPMGVDPWISSKWSKDNKEKRDEEGRLIPCA
jgi:DNA polymerase I-like protein with 3'-5' exonuclease and polymerase domains